MSQIDSPAYCLSRQIARPWSATPAIKNIAKGGTSVLIPFPMQ